MLKETLAASGLGEHCVVDYWLLAAFSQLFLADCHLGTLLCSKLEEVYGTRHFSTRTGVDVGRLELRP